MISGDIKRIPAPGRRSSNRRRKFRGDGLVEGIDYQPGDTDFFDDDDDETDDAEEYIRPSDLQKMLESEAMRNLEAQKRVTSELEALSLLEAEGTRADEEAQYEKAQREMQLRATLIERSRRESVRQMQEEEQIAIDEAVLRETRRKENLQRERLQAEEEQANEQRKLAAEINAERDRIESDMLQFQEMQRVERAKQPVLELDLVVDEVTSEKSRKTEAQRLKREAFLNDMNAFSQTIEEEAGRAALGRKSTANGTICEQYQPPSVRYGNELPPPPPPRFEIPKPSNRVHWENDTIESSKKSETPNSFKELTSSLFAANSANTVVNEFQSQSESDRNIDRNIDRDMWGESSGMNRAANVTAHQSGRSKRELPVSEYSDRGTGSGSGPAAGYEASQIDEVEEEEGMGGAASISNILTRDERKTLTVQQRVAWRALQADLTTRRKEFHGAVTYAFDGIFSWQMYGSTEAAEEGKAYTEYLMRCQWGTTWDNMQPWIVARRYREFDVLNFQLRRSYPSQASIIHTLPEKDFFRCMDSHVVDKRRRSLEEYMTRIVQRLPTVLRSKNMDEFLGVSDRIATIRALLGPNASLLSSQSAPSLSPSSGTSLRSRDEVAAPSVEEDGYGISILSVEAAENARDRMGSACSGLDEDLLGRLEEDIKDLGILLNMASPLDITRPGRLRDLLKSTTNRWPYLRTTATLRTGDSDTDGTFPTRDTDRDFCLIPRALQAEEDLLRIADDYRSLVFAGSLM